MFSVITSYNINEYYFSSLVSYLITYTPIIQIQIKLHFLLYLVMWTKFH